MKKIIHGFYILLALLVTACESTHNSVLGTSKSQVQVRNYQSRSFDTGDRQAVLRSIISTMQDLNFIINKADENVGIISGTSFNNSSKLTVSIRPVDGKQIIVRANAQAGLNAIENPASYQNFFNALSQSLFLDANSVE